MDRYRKTGVSQTERDKEMTSKVAMLLDLLLELDCLKTISACINRAFQRVGGAVRGVDHSVPFARKD